MPENSLLNEKAPLRKFAFSEVALK